MSSEPVGNETEAHPDPLDEGIARNAPLELHALSNDRTIPAARARMIGIDEQHIYLDRPQIIGRNVRINPTQEFEAFFSFGDELFTFRTSVVETHATVQLNQAKQVEGMVISRPDSVKPGQRRQFFRTSLAAIQQPVRARIQEVGEFIDEPKPRERGDWLFATITDASAGGFGVRVEDSNYSGFKMFHNYFVRFRVPESREELTVMCELRQVRPIQEGAATKLGFLLLPWPTQAKLNWKIQPLLSYLTNLQRARMAG